MAHGKKQSIVNGHKQCSKCFEWRALDQFTFRNKAKGTLRQDCKLCKKEYNKTYGEANRDVILENKKAYYQENKEAIDAYKKIYNEANKEVIAQKAKIYREENTEELRAKAKIYREENTEELRAKAKIYNDAHIEQNSERCKAYRESHKEELAEYNKAYREEHKEKLNEYNRAYNKTYYAENKVRIDSAHKNYYVANSHIFRANNSKRRAKKKQARPIYSNTKLIQLFTAHAVELTKATGIMHHLDHITPISKGGLDVPENLQILTQYQNLSKFNKFTPYVESEWIPEPAHIGLTFDTWKELFLN